ncbi:hypothetical protein D3C85_962860 [compost metagenome]
MLDPGPGQGRVQVIAAVHEHGAGGQFIAQATGGVQVLGPDRRTKAELAVVHQGDGLLVAADRHDAHHRAEALLAHHRHVMGNVDQYLGREVGAARCIGGEPFGVDQRPGAVHHGIGNLPAHDFGGIRRHQRAEGGGLIQRVAQHVLAGEFDEALDELRVKLPVHVDAFDGAAALPGVEETAVHQVCHGVLEIGIGAHIARVLATQFQAHAEETAHGGSLHDRAGLHGTGEVHLMHAPGGDDGRGLPVIEQQVVEQPIGQVGPAHRLGETLADQQGLRGVLENHAVARHQRRDDRVHRREVRIVPRRDHQHRAHRLALDQAAETCDGFRLHRRQCLRGDGDHVARALFKTAQLAGAIAHRSAHLPSQLRHDLVAHRQHRVDRRTAQGGAFLERSALPLGLGAGGRGKRLLDLVGIGIGTFGVDPAIDR